MSDDKIEKLREYLRNNRPKNRANLGNNSDNKEKYNKSLEKDFNLDNSNLDNSQISNNKTNSNKRDYDKEPLIIKSYERFFLAILQISSFFIGCVLTILLVNNSNGDLYMCFMLFFSTFIFIFISYLFYNIFNVYEIKLTNNYIQFYKNQELKREIFTKDINKNIMWLFGSTYLKKYKLKEILFFILFFVTISIFYIRIFFFFLTIASFFIYQI
ncbi:hypothetical protein [Campylobacter ureolyticus]|uniref:hypothetical protein n=1 Tax=Campylobacter ureolyticus TaxID=827 RepID=UPI0022B3B7A3|nr:hypothetical protein [Campylobacter ureolyticus]MCZ6169092.1 hypothetical protein [Campylobacter ureolyticus]